MPATIATTQFKKFLQVLPSQVVGEHQKTAYGWYTSCPFSQNESHPSFKTRMKSNSTLDKCVTRCVLFV